MITRTVRRVGSISRLAATLNLSTELSRQRATLWPRSMPGCRIDVAGGPSRYERRTPGPGEVGRPPEFAARSSSLPSRLIPHRHRPRAELQPAYELQVDMLREPREQCRSMAHKPGMHHELVIIDQSQLRQRQRESHAAHEQSLARLPLELLNGLPQIPAHELRVPIDPVQGARHDVLLCRVDRPGEGFHPGLHP